MLNTKTTSNSPDSSISNTSYGPSNNTNVLSISIYKSLRDHYDWLL